MRSLDRETADQTKTEARSDPHEPRVLVIDDFPLVRGLVALLLRREGFQVAEAAGGAEGIRLLCATPVDLVLTDLRMPDRSGWDVARAARQFWPGLPVVLVTADPDLAEAVPALRALVNGVIPKPVYPETLLRVVRARTGFPEAERRV